MADGQAGRDSSAGWILGGLSVGAILMMLVSAMGIMSQSSGSHRSSSGTTSSAAVTNLDPSVTADGVHTESEGSDDVAVQLIARGTYRYTDPDGYYHEYPTITVRIENRGDEDLTGFTPVPRFEPTYPGEPTTKSDGTTEDAPTYFDALSVGAHDGVVRSAVPPGGSIEMTYAFSDKVPEDAWSNGTLHIGEASWRGSFLDIPVKDTEDDDSN